VIKLVQNEAEPLVLLTGTKFAERLARKHPAPRGAEAERPLRYRALPRRHRKNLGKLANVIPLSAPNPVQSTANGACLPLRRITRVIRRPSTAGHFRAWTRRPWPSALHWGADILRVGWNVSNMADGEVACLSITRSASLPPAGRRHEM